MKYLLIVVLSVFSTAWARGQFIVSDYLLDQQIRSGNTQALGYSKPEAVFYAGGTIGTADGESHWVIRKTKERSQSWKTVFSIPLSSTPYLWAGFKGFAFDALGTVFAISRAMDRASTVHWVVHRSRDKGATWKVVDDYTPFALAGLNYPYHIASGTFGEICVAGRGADSSDEAKQTQWVSIVRCSYDGGDSWNTVDWLDGALGSGIAFGKYGEILVNGYELLPDNSSRLFSRISWDRGRSWKTIDRQTFPGGNGGAIAAFVDSRGHYYSIGSGHKTSAGLRQWFIRRSQTLGLSWETVDTYLLSPASHAEAYELTEQQDGTLLAVGYAQDDRKKHHMIWRRSSDQGKSWKTYFDFTGPLDLGVYGHNIAAGAETVMASGSAYLPSGRAWIAVEYRP